MLTVTEVVIPVARMHLNPYQSTRRRNTSVTEQTSRRHPTASYTTAVDADDGRLMTVTDYLEDVAAGFLIDEDGMGDVVRDGMIATLDFDDDRGMPFIHPSDGAYIIPQDATHILWYGR